MRENSVVVLTGPSHAEEVAMEMPTTVVAASENRKDAEYVQDAFMSTRFRVYTSPDVIGAETGAALKTLLRFVPAYQTAWVTETTRRLR